MNISSSLMVWPTTDYHNVLWLKITKSSALLYALGIRLNLAFHGWVIDKTWDRWFVYLSKYFFKRSLCRNQSFVVKCNYFIFLCVFEDAPHLSQVLGVKFTCRLYVYKAGCSQSEALWYLHVGVKKSSCFSNYPSELFNCTVTCMKRFLANSVFESYWRLLHVCIYDIVFQMLHLLMGIFIIRFITPKRSREVFVVKYNCFVEESERIA